MTVELFANKDLRANLQPVGRIYHSFLNAALQGAARRKSACASEYNPGKGDWY
jgi:hypothetical protein